MVILALNARVKYCFSGSASVIVILVLSAIVKYDFSASASVMVILVISSSALVIIS